MTDLPRALSIRVFGLVQGVGFRPFLHRVASELGINGWAINTNDSVRIHAEGAAEAIAEFVDSISNSPPPLARVERVETENSVSGGYSAFEIRQSESTSDAVTRVSGGARWSEPGTADSQCAQLESQPSSSFGLTAQILRLLHPQVRHLTGGKVHEICSVDHTITTRSIILPERCFCIR